jgi:hypothetical protein
MLPYPGSGGARLYAGEARGEPVVKCTGLSDGVGWLLQIVGANGNVGRSAMLSMVHVTDAHFSVVHDNVATPSKRATQPDRQSPLLLHPGVVRAVEEIVGRQLDELSKVILGNPPFLSRESRKSSEIPPSLTLDQRAQLPGRESGAVELEGFQRLHPW